MNNCFQKLVFAAIGSILSYSIININSAQATTISYNSQSEVSGTNFFTPQTTNTSLKIEQNNVINGVINSQPTAIYEAIVETGKLLENNNFEFKFVDSQSQTKFVSANIPNWQNNQPKETPKPLIEPGVLFGLGLISIRGFIRKKRL